MTERPRRKGLDQSTGVVQIMIGLTIENGHFGEPPKRIRRSDCEDVHMTRCLPDLQPWPGIC